MEELERCVLFGNDPAGCLGWFDEYTDDVIGFASVAEASTVALGTRRQ